MPQFPPGEAKTAIAPITAKPSGMSCEAALFLGPDELTKVATSGRVPFVSTGAAKNVILPITMPSTPGSYHGYIDVFAGGFRFLAYILKEDIVIAAPIAGIIESVLIWNEDLAEWEDLLSGREIPLNERIILTIGWLNKSEVSIIGHVDLLLTYPDGTKTSLPALVNQDRESLPRPGNGWYVWHLQFKPFIASQEGTYTVVATLSSKGQVLDSATFTLVSLPAIARFYVPAAMTKKLTDGTILDMYWNCECWLDITNNGDAAGTRIVHIWDSVGNVDIYITVTLQPGKTYTWYRAQWVDFRRISGYTVWAQGDWEENNYSVARFP